MKEAIKYPLIALCTANFQPDLHFFLLPYKPKEKFEKLRQKENNKLKLTFREAEISRLADFKKGLLKQCKQKRGIT